MPTIEIWVKLALVSYLGWFGKRNPWICQRGWYLLLMGFMIITLEDIFPLVRETWFITDFFPISEVKFNLIGLSGYILIFIGFLNWIPFIVQSIRHTKEQIQSSQSQNLHHEPKPMYEALRESEKLHRMLSENTPDLVCLHEIDGTYLYLSNAVKQLLGYKPHELIGQSLYLFSHPEDKKIIKMTHNKVKTGYSDNRMEYRIRNQRGQYIWFETYMSPIKGENDQIIKLVSSSREITQRKQAENALCDSQEQLQRRSYEIRQLYEFSREIGYTVDFLELANVLNEYLYRLLPNLSCSSLILTEENWHDWYHLFISSPYVLSQAVQNEIREEILKILSNNHHESMITEQPIPINQFDLDGIKTPSLKISRLATTQCISLIDSPSEPRVRKVVGTLWLGAEAQNAFTMEQLRISYTLVNHLVNALKRIHVLLDQERKHLENLVQYLPIGIILLDAQRRIISANPTAQEYLPLFTETAFHNHSLTGKIVPLLAPLFDGSSSALKAQLLPVNSQSFEITALLLEAGPYMGHYITIINDVTERHRMEAELQAERASLAERVEERTAELSAANMKLAKANQLKDEFLANMSHELRTPLNAILGGAEILIEQIYGSLTSEQLKYINNIYSSGQHLLSLINDILDLSKIEAGKMELQYGNISISELCQTSLLFIKELAYKKQIQVRSNISSQLNMLRADQRCLKQILINLLSNAVKFTPAGGHIKLTVRPDLDKPAVCFSVTDTGIGIAPENMSYLFKPFEQLDSGLARQYGGTGLGLALVQRLVELHGGSITVESQLDQGSCFTVIFPHRNEKGISAIIDEERSAPLPIPSRKNGPAPLILLAEDNQITIDIFVDYLRHLGYRINIARTGKEALERLAEERPALILMDIQMPGIDGLEATRSIRAQPEHENLPIIALTALTMPGDRERCLEAGVNDYLSKPANIRELVHMIEKYL